MTRADMDRVRDDFVASARRGVDCGFDILELHCAHGYLLHQFLSPLSNRRGDRFGGSLDNRMRFPLEVFAAVRAAWPHERPLGVRISATDWVPGGWDLEQSIAFARALEALDCDFIDVSSGGLSEAQRISAGPGYQTPFAAAIRQAVKMKVIAVGLITQPLQAETILATGQADMVGLARAMLDDPRWPWHAARELGAALEYPRQCHVMRQGSLSRRRGQAPDAAWVDWVISEWVCTGAPAADGQGQLAYYARKEAQNKARYRRTSLLGRVCLWSGIGVAILLLLGGAAEWRRPMLVLMACCR